MWVIIKTMIYIIGDTHNTVDMSNLSTRTMKYCCKEQQIDYHSISVAIILGAFGLPWSADCTINEAGILPRDHTDSYLLKWYGQKPFKILAVMGNHDNYDVIEKLPEVELFGAMALKVSDSVFYLKRGEVYTIENKRFLVLGGALSNDKAYRIPHESWWEQEAWTDQEKTNCLGNIEKYDGSFDYVLSHTEPQLASLLVIRTTKAMPPQNCFSMTQMSYSTIKLIPSSHIKNGSSATGTPIGAMRTTKTRTMCRCFIKGLWFRENTFRFFRNFMRALLSFLSRCIIG